MAWQDWAPATVRADAQTLARAATWLSWQDLTWAQATEATWAQYCAALCTDVDTTELVTRRRALRHVMTLHRAYAFWHWDNPNQVRFQPFPSRPLERADWLDHVLWSAGGRPLAR